MDGATTRTTGNHLLDRAPVEDAAELVAVAERVSLEQGREIYTQDGRPDHVVFLISGMASILIHLEQGGPVEAAAIGNEGMIGLAIPARLDMNPDTAVMQVPGDALRVPADRFASVVGKCGGLDKIIKRYAIFSLRSAHQTIACNLKHPLERRMCRWLLTTQDRAGGDTFPLTHEFLSEMLGARRPSVTVAAGGLQKAGLIRYRRGTLQILDRAGLLAASCECYTVIRDLYARIAG